MKTETKHLMLWGGGAVLLLGAVAYFYFRGSSASTSTTSTAPITQYAIPPDLTGGSSGTVAASSGTSTSSGTSGTSALNQALTSTVTKLAQAPVSATPATSSTVPQGTCGTGQNLFNGLHLVCASSVSPTSSNLANLYG